MLATSESFCTGLSVNFFLLHSWANLFLNLPVKTKRLGDRQNVFNLVINNFRPNALRSLNPLVSTVTLGKRLP